MNCFLILMKVTAGPEQLNAQFEGKKTSAWAKYQPLKLAQDFTCL